MKNLDSSLKIQDVDDFIGTGSSKVFSCSEIEYDESLHQYKNAKTGEVISQKMLALIESEYVSDC